MLHRLIKSVIYVSFQRILLTVLKKFHHCEQLLIIDRLILYFQI